MRSQTVRLSSDVSFPTTTHDYEMDKMNTIYTSPPKWRVIVWRKSPTCSSLHGLYLTAQTIPHRSKHAECWLYTTRTCISWELRQWVVYHYHKVCFDDAKHAFKELLNSTQHESRRRLINMQCPFNPEQEENCRTQDLSLHAGYKYKTNPAGL